MQYFQFDDMGMNLKNPFYKYRIVKKLLHICRNKRFENYKFIMNVLKECLIVSKLLKKCKN